MKRFRGIPIIEPPALRGGYPLSTQYIIQFKECERDEVRYLAWKESLKDRKHWSEFSASLALANAERELKST